MCGHLDLPRNSAQKHIIYLSTLDDKNKKQMEPFNQAAITKTYNYRRSNQPSPYSERIYLPGNT